MGGVLLAVLSTSTGSHANETDQARAREQAAAASLAESSAAVAAAGQALQRVRTALPAAEQQAARARGRQIAAQARARRADAAAEQADAAVQQARRALGQAAAKVDASRRDVALLARRAYQGGQLSELRTVMSASQPQDLLERAGLLQAVIRHRDASLDRHTAARLAVAGRAADLDRQAAAAAKASEAAAAAQDRAMASVAQADRAAAEVRALVAARAKALTVAESLRARDRDEYAAAQQESRELAARIRAAAAEARRRAAAQEAERREAERRARAAGTPPRRSAPQRPAPGGGWRWPADGPMTSDYGYRMHPIYGGRRLHAGIDIGAPSGEAVVAARSGTVIAAYYSSSYGNLTVVDHGSVNGERLTTAYAHQSSVLVGEGDTVSSGQVIGRVGSTGNSTGPHLHFEVRRDGEPVDPTRYVGRR